MINNPVIFYIAASILVFSALVSMFVKNILYSLLASIIVFFAAGLIFYVLGSEYNAIIQAAIYGFAVPIIIGLSIMFCSKQSKIKKTKFLSFLIMFISVIFLLFFTDTVILSLNKFPQTFNIVSVLPSNHYEVLSSFVKGIFINYVWAFELVSLLLTVVIAGFTLSGKRGGK